jgi:hypothetical protein
LAPALRKAERVPNGEVHTPLGADHARHRDYGRAIEYTYQER